MNYGKAVLWALGNAKGLTKVKGIHPRNARKAPSLSILERKFIPWIATDFRINPRNRVVTKQTLCPKPKEAAPSLRGHLWHNIND